jgi:serine/threonine protein phosphatase 1
MSQPVYALSDIHGQNAMLHEALDRIAADGGAEAPLVVVGDLVDRGPDSRGVIQTLLDGRAAGRDWTILRGNHDQMFLDFLTEAHAGAPATLPGTGWLSHNNGGIETLASYGIAPEAAARNWQRAQRAIPRAHIDLLSSLPLTEEKGDLLFVHAGIRPGVPLRHQSAHDLLWIREPFLDYTGDHPWLVVHGHTPGDRPRHYGNRVNLDGGAGWGNELFPVVFEGGDAWLLTKDGRAPLRP